MWAFSVDKLNTWAYQENIFTPEECKQIISIGTNLPKDDAKVAGANNSTLKNSMRKSKITWLKSENNTWMYERMAEATHSINERFFNLDLHGFGEDFQFTEYTAPDSHYNYHIDMLYNQPVRKLSLVLQLSDEKDYEGGELEIHNGNPTIMSKKQGVLLAFPSFILHRVKPVTEGVRYSLVSWVTGPQFK